MLRRLSIVVVALALAACSNCDNKCTEGITFYVADVAGALSPGATLPLHICLDGSCQDVTVSRDNVGGSIFVPFTGVDKQGDRELTVSSSSSSSLQGSYTGPIYSYTQDPGGDCSTCALATVKVAADGTLTPAVPAPTASTTTVAAPAATSNG